MKQITPKASGIIAIIFLFLSASAGCRTKASACRENSDVSCICKGQGKMAEDDSRIQESTVEETILEVHATVTLSDGSRLEGICPRTNLKIRTIFGDVTLPLIVVASFDLEKDGKQVKLLTHAGDALHGSLALPILYLETFVGRQEIELSHVNRAEFQIAKSEGLGAFLVSGKTRGGLRTEFVKGVPDELTAGLDRLVRRADMMGSVASRHDSARWLYPTSGEGEAPKVLLEDGRMLFPIWGTWRQRWHTGWEWFDENGSWIQGVKDRTTPHYETVVEYFVVPIRDERSWN